MRLTTSTSRRYRLADHVRACRHDDQVILLDLRRDKYLGIVGAPVASLSHFIVDWPAETATPLSAPGNAFVEAWVKKLEDQKMLSDASSKRLPSPLLPEPLESLHPDIHATARKLDLRRPLRLARSAASAALWVKRLSLAEIEGRVRSLRPEQCTADPQDCTARIHEVVSFYLRLRPFLFTAHDQCLHDSLTLVRYLASEAMSARWVIGVRTRPFAAHSWVQSGHVVLNDVHEHVRTFTPILVV